MKRHHHHHHHAQAKADGVRSTGVRVTGTLARVLLSGPSSLPNSLPGLEKWSQYDLGDPQILIEEGVKIKRLIRSHGVPNALRHRVWPLITLHNLKKRPALNPESIRHTYALLIQQTFGDHEHINVDHFPWSELANTTLPLHQEYNAKLDGQMHHDMIVLLTCLMHKYHEIHSPQLFDVLCILLKYLTIEEVAFTASNALKTPAKYFSNASTCSIFAYLVKRFLPKLHECMTRVGVHAYEFATTWINHVFVGVIPYAIIPRIFDAYLLLGIEFLFRFGLSLLFSMQADIFRCQTRGAFFNVLLKTTKAPYPDDIYANAWKFKIKPILISWTHTKCRLNMYPAMEVQVPLLIQMIKKSYSSQISAESMILNAAQWQPLYSWMPNRLRSTQPILLYRNTCDVDFNIAKLYKVSEEWYPTLLIAQTCESNILGCFLNGPWNVKDMSTVVGIRESFLFTLVPIQRHYPWAIGCASIFLVKGKDFLAIGGGGTEDGRDDGFGLYIDSRMQASSVRCATFNNEPLNEANSKVFRLIRIELFGLE